jgi:hypothetical protein
MDKFTEDFNLFWSKIENEENFSFARYADGEVRLMKGLDINHETQAYKIDKWKAPNKKTKVGIDLYNTLNHTEHNYYYAISGINDNINDYSFLIQNIKQNKNNVTFVNLWINNNYTRMIEKLKNLKREVILICNESAKEQNFPFPIKEIFHFPNDCVDFWEKESELFMNNLFDEFSNLENQLFFISCGPVSEIIIHGLYTKNPNNTYIDVGSSIDEFVHGYKTRPYMYEYTQYHKHISQF